MTKPKDSANRAIERYTGTGWLRAVLSLVPLAGPALDALVTATASEITRKRIEQFAAELRSIGETLEEKLDKSAIETPEWLDLAIRALSAATRTADKERLRMYAAILLGSATPDWPKEIDNEAALAALAELTPREVRIVRYLRDQSIAQGQQAGSAAPAMDAWNKAIEGIPDELRPDLSFHLKRIERVGFISELTGAFLDYGGGIYVLTPTFVRLMKELESAGGLASHD